MYSYKELYKDIVNYSESGCSVDFDGEVQKRLIDEMHKLLDSRDLQVLNWRYIDGMCNVTIGRLLRVSSVTVKNILKNCWRVLSLPTVLRRINGTYNCNSPILDTDTIDTLKIPYNIVTALSRANVRTIEDAKEAGRDYCADVRLMSDSRAELLFNAIKNNIVW